MALGISTQNQKETLCSVYTIFTVCTTIHMKMKVQYVKTAVFTRPLKTLAPIWRTVLDQKWATGSVNETLFYVQVEFSIKMSKYKK